jgi:tRNA A-37 threonylcarbamoyl transferase component Bud32
MTSQYASCWNQDDYIVKECHDLSNMVSNVNLQIYAIPNSEEWKILLDLWKGEITVNEIEWNKTLIDALNSLPMLKPFKFFKNQLNSKLMPDIMLCKSEYFSINFIRLIFELKRGNLDDKAKGQLLKYMVQAMSGLPKAPFLFGILSNNKDGILFYLKRRNNGSFYLDYSESVSIEIILSFLHSFLLQSNSMEYEDSDLVLTENLGEGATCIVFSGYHKEDVNNPFAVKLLKPNTSTRELVKSSFKREAQVLKQLNHDNIPKLIDNLCCVDDPNINNLRLVMRPVGVPMTSCQRWTIEIALDILNALEAAHQLNILHCDVRPENIIVDNHRGYLIDWGFSRDREHSNANYAGAVYPYVSNRLFDILQKNDKKVVVVREDDIESLVSSIYVPLNYGVLDCSKRLFFNNPKTPKTNDRILSYKKLVSAESELHLKAVRYDLFGLREDLNTVFDLFSQLEK